MGCGEAFLHIFPNTLVSQKALFQHFSGIFMENCQFSFSEKMRIENIKNKRRRTLKVKIPKRKQSNATLIHFLALELIRKASVSCVFE